MPEKPPVPNQNPELPPPEKPLEEMTIPELEVEIKKLSEELDDLLERRRLAKDVIAKKALEMEISRKLQKRAGYQMRRQELLSGGSGQA